MTKRDVIGPGDEGKTPEQLCAERTQRILDAAAMKEPDRVT